VVADTTVRPTGTFRAALTHRDFRRLFVASAISQTGDWLYNVALLVYVYDATRSTTWVAAVSALRLLPFVLFSPLGGLIADAWPRRTVLVIADLLRAGIMGVLALATAGDSGPAVVALLAFLSTTFSSVYMPAVVGLVPDVVGESDLAAANGLTSLVENLATLVGPAIGAALLVVTSPSAAFAFNAGSFLLSAVITATMSTRGVPSRRAHKTDLEDTDLENVGEVERERRRSAPARLVTRLGQGAQALFSSSTARALGGCMFGSNYIYGLQTVVFVLVADEVLDIGTDAVTIMYVALGVGGLIGAPLTRSAASSARLGLIVGAGLLLLSVPMAMLAYVNSTAVAFGLVLMTGVGTVLVEVLALTLLQRTVPRDIIGRVWGILDVFVVGSILIGGFVVAPAVDWLGLEAALVLLPLLLPVVAITWVSGLMRADRESAIQLERLAPVIMRIEHIPIFAGAPRAVIEQLARVATQELVPPFYDVVVQGEPAEHFYVVAEGELAVLREAESGGEPTRLSVLVPGDYFGEIGLLHEVPRTATVRSLSDATLYRISGTDFLSAVNEAPTLGASVTEGVVRRLATHERA
jgi:MFS family permease